MDTVLQAALNGLVSGTILALPAIGFTAMFAVLRYPNFAVAAFATLGAYGGWMANAWLGWPVVAALVAAFALAGLVGACIERVALEPLRPAGPLTVAIAAIALNVVIENVLRFSFGNDLRGYDLPLARDVHVAGLRIAPQQIENLVLALAVMAALFGFLAFTRIGKAMRATADNPDLARLKGIEPRRVELLAVLVGAGLCGVGGMLLGLDTSVDPLTGFRVVLSVFAAAVVGGLGSIPGAVAGALVIGLAEELATLVVAPTYKSAVGFVAILLVLTLRPRGLLGERAY
ncbi:branched-chain amino acid ABC transporter permease [Vineibacter terrae]|uniref:branched-chain amino acid ABC transporter permease n=1 Tax=Vineibacter terrae TaxID=2586908 RepID=UPI002E363E94|nr:branched-chain amino acid ABC transporter permease [Vineibacter terrae]HEX2886596.1 branched-chain amino acid ABC transporter permease [Vineibacter terrae]